MHSLRAVLRLGSQRCARIVTPLRNGAYTSSEVNIRLPSNGISCYFSSKKRNEAYQLEENPAFQNIDFPKADLKESQDESQRRPRKQTGHDTDIIDELFADSQQASRSSSEYLLTDWCRQVAQLKNAELPDKLKRMMAKRLPDIVKFALTPSAAPDLRHKCLTLLLIENTDEKLTSYLLNQTVADAAYLPIKVISDIVHTLSTSFETPLRKETRTKLVTAVINERWYEIAPKFVIFFLYQLDELFDMKEVSRQLRNRGSHENPSYVQETGVAKVTDAGKDENDFEEEEKSLSNDIRSGATVDSERTPGVTVDGERTPGVTVDGERTPGATADGERTPGATVDGERTPVMSINLESRAISVVNELKAKDLARIVILLGKWRNRNETLLNSIVHTLCQADLLDFSFIQLNNLLFSFSVLNVHNEEVLRNIVWHLSQMVPTSPSLACTTLASLSHLRWNDEVLVSKFLSFLAEHMSDVTVKDAYSVLMSLANLYAAPKNETEANLIIKLASKVYSKDVSPAYRVNCAWCLAILISLGAEFGETLLQPEFVKQLSDADDFQKQTSLQKLSSVNTAFQYEVSGYSGPLLSEEIFHPTSQGWTGCSSKTLNTEFINALRQFVDLDTYTKLGQALKGGIVVDAVMCADSSGNVRPLSLNENERDKVYKLAIQLVPYSGVLSITKSPAGSYCMTARHLKHLGYVPVQILHSDLMHTKSKLEKINSIRTKIKAAVSDASAQVHQLQD